jgi:hypothetical protein
MKFLILLSSILLIIKNVNSFTKSRILRPEEHWRPAKAWDISKLKSPELYGLTPNPDFQWYLKRLEYTKTTDIHPESSIYDGKGHGNN